MEKSEILDFINSYLEKLDDVKNSHTYNPILLEKNEEIIKYCSENRDYFANLANSYFSESQNELVSVSKEIQSKTKAFLDMVEVIDRYITKEGKIISYPGKKHRAVREYIYVCLASHFDKQKEYSEPEINAIIKDWILYDDFVTLRRELVDFGYLSRSNDCRKYWLSK